MSRHGTWTETGNTSGGWGVGVLAAVVAGVWLAANTRPTHHLPAAAGDVPAEATGGVRAHAAGQLVAAGQQAGHGVGWWALLAAGLFAAAVFLAVVVAAGWQAWARHRTRQANAGPDGPVASAPAQHQVPSAGASVIVLADYARRDSARRAAGGAA